MDPHFLYMRWWKEGKVERVARHSGGAVLYLLPTENPENFIYGGVVDLDTASAENTIERKSIEDYVWLGLLDGKKKEDVLNENGFENYYNDQHIKRARPLKKGDIDLAKPGDMIIEIIDDAGNISKN